MRIAVALTTLGLLFGVDRVEERSTAGKLANGSSPSSTSLPARRFRSTGLPFLPQLFKGRYDDVTITANAPIEANGVTVDNAVAHLHGLKVGLADAIHGTVSDLPVQSGTGTALITYLQLDTIVHRYGGQGGQQITGLAASPEHARLAGPLGLSLTDTAVVSNGALIITPEPAQLGALPGLVKALVTDALARSIPLPTFPFNVRLESIKLDTTVSGSSPAPPTRCSPSGNQRLDDSKLADCPGGLKGALLALREREDRAVRRGAARASNSAAIHTSCRSWQRRSRG